MYFELTVQAKDYWLPKYRRRFNQHRQDQFSTNIFSTKAKNLKNLPCSQDIHTLLNSQDISELTPSPQLPLPLCSHQPLQPQPSLATLSDTAAGVGGAECDCLEEGSALTL